MTDWAEQKLAELRPQYPQWCIWIVRTTDQGVIWCARPAGSSVATVNAGSPQTLAAQIQQQEPHRTADR